MGLFDVWLTQYILTPQDSICIAHFYLAGNDGSGSDITTIVDHTSTRA
jgi:hypothetical protein